MGAPLGVVHPPPGPGLCGTPPTPAPVAIFRASVPGAGGGRVRGARHVWRTAGQDRDRSGPRDRGWGRCGADVVGRLGSACAPPCEPCAGSSEPMTVTGDMGASLEPSSGPLVSVVVPTRNSARTIERCLQSIVGQRPTRLELIVVDNDSTDGTFAIATSYADVVLRAG